MVESLGFSEAVGFDIRNLGPPNNALRAHLLDHFLMIDNIPRAFVPCSFGEKILKSLDTEIPKRCVPSKGVLIVLHVGLKK